MILAEVAELALRATGLGCIVGIGLKLTRVRDPKVQMTVWTTVLLAALAMPVLEPWTRLTLPSTALPAPARPVLTMLPALDGAPFHESSFSASAAAAPPAGPAQELPATADRGRSWDWLWWATLAYLVIAGAMMMRLLIGLAIMSRIAAAARPLNIAGADRANIRLTSVVRVPVTFASCVLLPTGSATWDEQKRRIVLLHEGVHVNRRDFYRLLLASLYRAAFWFSPFAWWLQHHLADLAEMICDDAVVAETGDPRCYADILLEMAEAAPLAPAGLAMAHAASVPRRVKRILSKREPPAASGRSKGLIVGLAVLPLAVISTGSIRFDNGASVIGLPIDGARDARATDALDRFVGDYQIGVGSLVTIMRTGRQLSARRIGEPAMALRPAGDREFASGGGDERIVFLDDHDGAAAGIELHGAEGRVERGRRIDASLARLVEQRFAQRVAAAPDRFVRQTPAAGGDDRLRQIIDELQRGAPDYKRMSPQLANQMHTRAPVLQEALSRLGQFRTLSFRGVGSGGYDIYEAEFAKGAAEFRLDLAEDGTIDDLIFHPEGDGRPGGVADCRLQATLTPPAADAAPIRVTLINRSGFDVRLRRLGPAGRWLAAGSLESGFSSDVLTDVGRPLMISDAQGTCRQIILPGQSTRVHVITAAPDAAAPLSRDLPANGSYEALQGYISALRSGELKQELLTPQAAATARPLLQQRQAILGRLGRELVASFRGVTSTGSDIYRVRFANGTADWQIAMTKDGLISEVSLLP